MLQLILWRNLSYTKPLSTLEGRRYNNLFLPREILLHNSGSGINIKTFASRKSERKPRRRKDLKVPQNTSQSEKIITENESEVLTNNKLPSGDTTNGQLTIVSRSQVLKACIATSAGLVLFGILIRQASHLGFINGWPIHDASELNFRFETWHAGLVLGQVILISSSRFILLKVWPDFAKSSEAANQQILSSLEPLDLVVVAFIPGISEEFLFRGGIMPLFGLDWKSALVTGVIFGILHLNGGRKYDYAIWATLVGFAYGLTTIASSSLLVPMASHSLNNLIGALFWRFKDSDSIKNTLKAKNAFLPQTTHELHELVFGKRKQYLLFFHWTPPVFLVFHSEVESEQWGKPSEAWSLVSILLRHMESLLSEKKPGLLDRSFYQQVTKEFNRSSRRVGTEVIQINQVQKWFENKLRKPDTEITNLPLDSKEDNVAETSSQITMDEKEKIPPLDELEFEAKSQRDFAWYDVSKFMANRVTTSGEVEVKVRYENFGEDEDEWVNVKKCMRLRSVPLEATECDKVQVGDLVLCFREKNKEALHFDARVIEVERKLHDMRGCRCQFLVRYDHDQTDEKVNLRRLCGRPPWASVITQD